MLAACCASIAARNRGLAQQDVAHNPHSYVSIQWRAQSSIQNCVRALPPVFLSRGGVQQLLWRTLRPGLALQASIGLFRQVPLPAVQTVSIAAW